MTQNIIAGDNLAQFVADKIELVEGETVKLCQRIKTLQDIKLFTQQHVFAVWDFKCLIEVIVKRLDPGKYPQAASLMRNIYAEEVYDNIGRQVFSPDKDLLSHYELYLIAMRQIGADTGPITGFVELVEARGIEQALVKSTLPEPTKDFVRWTFSFFDAPLPRLLAAFVFGREAITAKMFGPLICCLEENTAGTEKYSALKFYLERHIAVDNDVHLPQALSMLDSVCETKEDWLQARVGAYQALLARFNFLSSIISAETVHQLQTEEQP